MRNGIDISPWQHPRGDAIDWPTVANHGYLWMADKINEGMDDGYAVDWPDFPAAAAVGVETVAYHFARPTSCSPLDAADKFVALCEAHAPDARRCLDLEDGEQLGWVALHSWMTAFMARAQADVLYVNRNYLTGLNSAGGCDGLLIWVAIPGATGIPDGLYACQFGQGAVPGIPATVDLNFVTDDTHTPGGDDMTDAQLDRLINELHTAMQEQTATVLAALRSDGISGAGDPAHNGADKIVAALNHDTGHDTPT